MRSKKFLGCPVFHHSPCHRGMNTDPMSLWAHQKAAQLLRGRHSPCSCSCCVSIGDFQPKALSKLNYDVTSGFVTSPTEHQADCFPQPLLEGVLFLRKVGWRSPCQEAMEQPITIPLPQSSWMRRGNSSSIAPSRATHAHICTRDDLRQELYKGSIEHKRGT